MEGCMGVVATANHQKHDIPPRSLRGGAELEALGGSDGSRGGIVGVQQSSSDVAAFRVEKGVQSYPITFFASYNS
jgi:hypothetical protein